MNPNETDGKIYGYFYVLLIIYLFSFCFYVYFVADDPKTFNSPLAKIVNKSRFTGSVAPLRAKLFNPGYFKSSGPDSEVTRITMPYKTIKTGKGPFVRFTDGENGLQEKIIDNATGQTTTKIIKQPESATLERYGSTGKKTVALTFDDGPSRYTYEFLSVLKKYSVPATFFLVGKNIKRQPSSFRAIINSGYGIGNHSYSHIDITSFDKASAIEEIAKTSKTLMHYRNEVKWFRPPGGRLDYNSLKIIESAGLVTVLWTVDPSDWKQPGASKIAQRVISATRPGAVVLLHDGGGNRKQTLAALPVIITELRKMGYTFVNLHELLKN